jgi:GxxExxY protein
VAHPLLNISYKEIQLDKCYIPDFVAFDKIIIEIKAIEQLTPREEAQVVNYLKVTGFELGLLINFGAESLEWRRKVLSKKA